MDKIDAIVAAEKGVQNKIEMRYVCKRLHFNEINIITYTHYTILKAREFTFEKLCRI